MVARRRRAAALAATALGLTIAGGAATAHAALQAQLEQREIADGDTVDLVLHATGDDGDTPPDLAPLAKDFEIVGTSQSQQLTIANGRREASRDWIVRLRPRAAGDVVVPAIHAGDAATAPLALKVRSASAPARDGAAPRDARSADLFVETEVDDAQPIVQGEVRYTVRVLDAIGMREGALSEPHADQARLEPRGDMRTYETTRGGKRYRVHERDYSLFPQASGEVTIPPVTLEARVPEPRGQGRPRSIFDDVFGDDDFPFGGGLFAAMMNPGREVRVRSNPVTLHVQARPGEAADGWFLPAKRVELAQSWEPAKPSFRVGDAVRRTIVLRALGASSEQLPRFEVPSADGVRQYPDGTRDQTVPTDEGVVSVLEQTVGIVPLRAGTLTLPPVEVRWFDVQSKEARTATLPAETIDVLPAAGASASASTATAPAAAPHAPTQKSAQAAAPAAPAATDASGAAASPARPEGGRTTAAGTPPAAFWPQSRLVVPGAAAAALLVAAGAWLALRRRRAAAAPEALAQSGRARSRPSLDAIRRACDANDPRAARDALIEWARATWPERAPANVAAIARRLDHEGFGRAAAALDAHLYGRAQTAWDGAALLREIGAASKQAQAEASSDPALLPRLYPSTRAA